MAEVGYLIGAGASAECVPVVNGMANSIRNIKVELRKHLLKYTLTIPLIDGTEIQAGGALQRIETILDRIAHACRSHYSIDTYAKKLYVSGKSKEFKKLKKELSLYFTLIQILNPTDKRYDNFWASILNNAHPPKKVKIFSWNYDFQFERSYMNFSGAKSLSDTKDKLGICAPWYFPEKNIENNFMIAKLNGTAQLRDTRDNKSAQYYCDFASDNIRDQIHEVVRNLYQDTEHFFNNLEFAWERENNNIMLEKIKPALNKIVILVVIGYSFPFFNRKVDQFLFDNMTSLQKIIIQDMDPEAIEERLVEFIGEEVNIELKRDVGQFVFPKQLEV